MDSQTQIAPLLGFKYMVDGASTAIGVSRFSDGRYVEANEAFLQLFGYTRAEIIGHTSAELGLWADPEQREVVVEQLEKYGRARNFLHRYRCKSGRTGHALVSVDTIERDGERCLMGFLTDIGDLEQAKQAAIESEKTYQALFQNMLNGFAYCHMLFENGQPIDFVYLNVNTAFSELTGLRDVVGRKVSEVIPGFLETDAELISTYGRVAAGGDPEYIEIYVEGLRQWFAISIYSPEPEHFVAIFDVVTVRKEAERRLRSSTAQLQLVLDATSDGFWDWDVLRKAVYLSPRYFDMTGEPAQEGVRDVSFFRESVHPDDWPQVQANIVAHLKRNSAACLFEFRLRNHDGTLKWMGGRGRVVERDSNGRALRMVGTVTDISARIETETALKNRKQQLARVIAGSDQGYWDWDLASNEFSVSAKFEEMLGYVPGELDASVANWGNIVLAEDLAKAMQSIQRHLDGLTPAHEVEVRCLTKNGQWRWILTRGRIVTHGKDGKPEMMSGTFTDIHEKKTNELALKQAATVFMNSYEGIMVVAVGLTIVRVNPAFSRITGYTPEEIVGNSPKVLSSGRHDRDFYETMWKSIAENDFWRGEVWNRRKNGEVYAEMLSISVVRDANGIIQNYVGVFSDVSQSKAHEAELNRIAHYDSLTGIPNRRLLSARLTHAISHARRSGKQLAVCYLDIDGFKPVNDLYGHEIGDCLLVQIAYNLQEVLRVDDTIARLGGDEFVLLLSDVSSSDGYRLILERILSTVRRPAQIGELTVQVSASIGVSLFPDDDSDADTLLRHADQAMYRAKDAGKNCYQLFDPEIDRKVKERQLFSLRLKQALSNAEFVLYYQPKVDLRNGEIVGAEALIRWQHPERGVLAPAVFLEAIMGGELEKPLGEWVIDTALAQISAWKALGLPVPVSVNISAHHLLQPDFCERLAEALLRHEDVLPEFLELEVLETAAIADIDQANKILRSCKELGVKFALDDFGTGYSSLTYLRKLPVDTLKIDQSFIRDMHDNHDDFGIVEGVIGLANVFNRHVIAEGAETLRHCATLLRLGCYLAQGYGIARPMPAGQFMAWSVLWKKQAAWEKNFLE